VYLVIYVLALAALMLHAPDIVWQPGAREFFVIMGVIGAWRYSWNLVHLTRSMIYRKRVYPAWRAKAFRRAYGIADPVLPSAMAPDVPMPEEGRAPELYIAVTSFRIAPETTALVFRAAIDEAVRYGVPTTIVASMVELADERLIKALFKKLAPPEQVRLVIVRLGSSGKRNALSGALKAVVRLRPHPDALVCFLDGDTLLAPGTFARCVPFFHLMPEIGGLTTDEDCVVRGSRPIVEWHRQRFAQRDLLMGSMALSRRLLAMTGRMSMFRIAVATDPGFVEMIASDSVDHWRLGRFRLLTGEDKSTWLWLLQRGWRMVYVPDVRIVTIEDPPHGRFVPASSMLMLRWFGNMLRAGGRAIRLGPRRLGPFTWWCLIDQRISMWTPLFGPLVAISFAIQFSPWFLYTYLLWIMTTRLIQTLLLLSVRVRISGLWPFMIYYNQVYGALIKSYVLFRMDRQRWTRQNIAIEATSAGWRGRLERAGSTYVHALALGSLAALVAFWTGLLRLPDGLARSLF
jgi:mannuronan synthase